MASAPPACHVLLGLAARSVPGREPGEIRLFAKCRNERLRMPAFLRHYRRLGVHRFFIADNASSDETTEYLLAQPDVHVFRTADRFAEARGGTSWLNALLSQYGPGGWCVTVDVDELLYYPGSESADLGSFTAHLDEQGAQAVACLLLDMYPRVQLKDCRYAPGDELEAAAPLFDPEPYVYHRARDCPYVLIEGGVRERVFYPEVRARKWHRRLLEDIYRQLVPRLPLARRMGWVQRGRPQRPPCLTKVPLVRWDEHTAYLEVNHFVTPRALAAETGVLLHFKFLGDFHRKAVEEAARGEYFDGASEYKRYAERLRHDNGLTLTYAGSVLLKDTRQLVGLKLMTDTPGWTVHRQRSGSTTP
jgi:hypothetical protein